MGKGYTKIQDHQLPALGRAAGHQMQTQWSQSGRLLIHEILNRRGILAVMDRERCAQ